MKIRTLLLAAGLSVAFASTSMANIVGSTYNFSGSATGSTLIGATNGTYTDPANPAFCVGPPVNCAGGSGLFGSFSFADLTPNLGSITFSFFGSTAGAPGSFSIDLSNFALPGGDTIGNITYGSGNLNVGSFSSVTWNGSHAIFTGSTASAYNAIGGNTVVFNVTKGPAAVPEPTSLSLLATTVLGGLFVRLKKRLT